MPLFDPGIVQIYTGNGKGKTTAAMGLAVRACGWGARVGMIQFLKGWDFYGEIKGLASLPGFRLVRTGRAEYVRRGDPDPRDFEEAARGLATAREWIEGGEFDLVILDEINVALSYGLLAWSDLREILDARPSSVEVVLTGRYAPEELLAYADLVTEMREIRHPYAKGMKAKPGREH